jgi:hypothetical protein
MKKYFVFLLILLIQVVFVIPAFAEVKASPPMITIDGEKLNFTVDPMIEDGTTLVQFRPIFEKLGLKIEWDGANQRITGTKEGFKIELTIGSITAVVNGKEIPLQKAPRLVNGNTVIPLRFVGEASGKVVNWDASTQLVSIKDKPSAEAIDNKQTDETTAVTSTDGQKENDSSNINLNQNELNSLISINSKKSVDTYNDIELKNLNKALAMDKTLLFEMLVSQYDYNLQDTQTNHNITDFIKKYLVADLQKLVDYSFSVSESSEKGYAVNQILDAMPDDKDYHRPDDQNFKMLTEILEKHPNPDVRYDVAFKFNRYINEAVFNEVTNVMAIEKNELVFGSVVGVAISKAGINADKILLLFNKYNDLSDSLKYKYNLMLTYAIDRDVELKFTWKTFLVTKMNNGTDIDKKNANEITDFVLNGKGNPLYPAGSDGAKIQNTMKQYTDSYANKDIDAYVDAQVKVADDDKQKLIQWYKDYSKDNDRYIINDFDITSMDGNIGKAKVGILVQSLGKSNIPNFDTHQVQLGSYVSMQSQLVFNVSFTKNKNGDWKISNLDRTFWYNFPPDPRVIFVK